LGKINEIGYIASIKKMYHAGKLNPVESSEQVIHALKIDENSLHRLLSFKTL
jgi:hypothetical protein